MHNTSITETELQQFRADTAGTIERIHFNNAGASLPPDIVVSTVCSYLKEEAVYGGYETEDKYRDQLDHTYDLIARLINAGRNEVAITENASMGWGLAFNGIGFREGDEVITSEMEYITNLLGFAHAQKKFGIKLVVLPNDGNDNFSLTALEEAITPRTRLIAMTHIASSTGSMMPIVEIGRIARRHNILYLVDACQTIGHVPLDVRAIGCDMLAVTARKFLRGPRGIGFLYVRKEIQEQLEVFFMDSHTAQMTSPQDYKLREDARRFELYEKNRALVLGLGQAIGYALNVGVDRIWERITMLAGLLRSKLAAIDGVTVHDKADRKCGIVTFSVAGIDAFTIKAGMAAKKINVSVAKVESTFIYMHKHQYDGIVRASVHYYNSEEEIQILCDALRSALTDR